jgi:hypothetical protein
VFREPDWVQVLINLRFLAVEPGGNCSLQANLFCLLTLTQVEGGCNDTEETWGRRGVCAGPVKGLHERVWLSKE